MNDIASISNEILTGQGFVILPEVLSASETQAARDTILQLAEAEKQQGKLLIDGKRERLFGLIYKDKIFEMLVQHPKIIEIIETMLGEDMTMSGHSAHILNPGATSMGIHVDYPYFAMKPPFSPHPIMNVQVIWMVEGFTEKNGAPVFAPGSQTLGSLPKSSHFSQIAKKLTGKAGSAILSHGLCWHDTSANSADKPRVSILANYTPKFVRPMLDISRDMPQEVLDNASPKLKQLLGYEFQSSLFQDIQRISSTGWK
jgi:ectoine hydroxylase-related dioxygenase (phytanoyl-CoA dioxygenase family)